MPQMLSGFDFRRIWKQPLLLSVFVLVMALSVIVGAAQHASAGSGVVQGVVFRDFNLNGAIDTSDVAATDLAVSGVAVTAYDGTGMAIGTAVTGDDGSYQLDFDSDEDTTRVRVEFTLPAGYQEGPVGPDSGTSVQFVSDGGTANLGIATPGDFSVDNPLVIIPTHFGGTLEQARTTGALHGVPYVDTGTRTEASYFVATQDQVGSTFGVAALGTDYVASSAILKRHAMLGPDGVGAIYLSEATPGVPNADLLVTIPNAGTDPRGGEIDGYDYFFDASVPLDAVYRTGLGDMDNTPDFSTLYVVNLNNRKLYEVPISGAGTTARPTAGTPRAIDMPLSLPGASTGCAAASVRPFGLEVTAGEVWASLTCTGPAQSDLRGYVYRYDIATETWDNSPVLEFDLTYRHGDGNSYFGNDVTDWDAWTDSEAEILTDMRDGYLLAEQPVLSDITFDTNGDMTIGIENRVGDLVAPQGFFPSGTSEGTPQLSSDSLRACLVDGTYVLESAGVCGDRTGSSADNQEGPGGGEFYQDISGTHTEYNRGPSEQVPGFPDILQVHNLVGGNKGYERQSNANGKPAANGMTIVTSSFYKSDGIGEIEALTGEAPLSIGNYVWLDTDSDGIQDPNEDPVEGVTVNLYDSNGDLVDSVVTGPDGEYYFTSTEHGLMPGTAYTIRLDNPDDYAPGGPLENLSLTTNDAGTNDLIDSDGTEVDGYPEISHTTGSLGTNDHSLDFGVVEFVPKMDLALRKTLATGQAATVAAGESVNFLIEVFNQGNVAATDIVVTDSVPAGMTFDPAKNTGWTLVNNKPTTTISGPLDPQTSTTLNILLDVSPTATSAVDLINNAEISDFKDEEGNPATDIDSTPDPDQNNDVLTDDVIDKTAATGDEDDHDIAQVALLPPPGKFDLALRKKLAPGGPTTVTPGSDVNFNIEVFNQGSIAATDIEVTDYVPAGMTFNPAKNPDWTLVNGRPTRVVPGPLAPANSTVVSIILTLDPNVTGTFINNAEISDAKDGDGATVTDIDSSPDDSLGNDPLIDDEINKTPSTGDEDDHDIAPVTVPPPPGVFDLALRKTLANPTAAVAIGSDVPFNIVVFNQGSVAGTNIVVTDSVPAGMTFDPAKNPGWSLVSGKPTTTIPGPLAPGESTSLTLVLKVDESATGKLINNAEVSDAKDPNGDDVTDVDSQPDTDPNDDELIDDEINKTPTTGDEDDHDIAEVNLPGKEFDLAIRKKVTTAPTPVKVGSEITFGIEVFNQGDITAKDVVVTDTMPTGLTFDPASNPGWTLVDGKPTTTVAGPIEPGQSKVVSLILKVASGATGKLVNNVEISDAKDPDGKTPKDIDSTPDKDPNDELIDDEINKTPPTGDEDDHDIAEITVPPPDGVFDLALRKTLRTTSGAVYVGDTVTFDIEVFNQGSIAAKDIVIVDYLPQQLVLATGTPNNAVWTSGSDGKVQTTVAGPIEPGKSVKVPIDVRIVSASATETVNKAEITTAKDPDGKTPDDIDSNPDDKDDDKVIDDEINKTPSTGDEDDHDIAGLKPLVFDLAIRKVVSPDQDFPVSPGDDVKYSIEVFNQGDVTAKNIVIVDYIPEGMSFNADRSPGWTSSDGLIRTMLVGPIAPGKSSVVTITFTVNTPPNGQALPEELINEVEIEDYVDEKGNKPKDIDSVPDKDSDNDETVDDEINNRGGDEDDNDIARITPNAPAGSTNEPPPPPLTLSPPGQVSITNPQPVSVLGSSRTKELVKTGGDVLQVTLVGLGLLLLGIMMRRKEVDTA